MDINVAALGAGLTTVSAQTSVAAAPAIDPLATARFEQIMNAAAPPASGASGASVSTDTTAPAVPPPGARTLGDNILAGMQNISSDFQQSWRAVNAALEAGHNMTTADMLKLQLGLTQMSVQYDLVGKAISRSTQNLDQLVKLQ